MSAIGITPNSQKLNLPIEPLVTEDGKKISEPKEKREIEPFDLLELFPMEEVSAFANPEWLIDRIENKEWGATWYQP